MYSVVPEWDSWPLDYLNRTSGDQWKVHTDSYGFYRISILEGMVACGRFDFKTLLILLVVLG